MLRHGRRVRVRGGRALRRVAGLRRARLLPAVREASPDTLIVADGFSCREQIAQGTDRVALHLAEVLQLAIESPRVARCGRPEAALVRRRRLAERRANLRAGALAAAAVGAAGAAWWAAAGRSDRGRR